MAAGASKRIQPSPSAGCSPRTRATSYAMSTTLAPDPDSAGPDWAANPADGDPDRDSHTRAVNFGFGVLIAVLLLTVPGALVARAGGLRWPLAARCRAGIDLRARRAGHRSVRCDRHPVERAERRRRPGVVTGLLYGLPGFAGAPPRAASGAALGRCGSPRPDRRPRGWCSARWPSAWRPGAASPTGSRSRAPGTRCGTPTPSDGSSTPARPRPPTWESCAMSRPTPRCTTRRRSTLWRRCWPSSPARPRPPPTR